MKRDEYIDISGRSLSNMRLMIEGAVNLYEEATLTLMKRLYREDKTDAAIDINVIGAGCMTSKSAYANCRTLI